jgi:hypothetical protein
MPQTCGIDRLCGCISRSTDTHEPRVLGSAGVLSRCDDEDRRRRVRRHADPGPVASNRERSGGGWACQSDLESLKELFALLHSHRGAFNQERTFLRMQALLFGHPFCFARRTITQALVSLVVVDIDWSAFCRLFGVAGRMDYEALSSRFLGETPASRAAPTIPTWRSSTGCSSPPLRQDGLHLLAQSPRTRFPICRHATTSSPV